MKNLDEAFQNLDHSLFREGLKKHEWVEGKHLAVAAISYRHVLMIACYPQALNKAEFSNGEFPYFAYIAFTNRSRLWNKEGAIIVPVLPDGRLIMIVDRRPSLACYPKNANPEFNDKTLVLQSYESLEFPGGAIENEEEITCGALRELYEESGVENQKAVLYFCHRPVHTLSSDVAIRGYNAVVFLTQNYFPESTDSDGGLRVVALTVEEVKRNIWRGAIQSGPTLHAWSFYQEVASATRDQYVMRNMIGCGYLSTKEITIKRK